MYVFTVHQFKKMNLPQIIPNANHVEASKLTDQSSESLGVDSELDDAWLYGCVLKYDPSCMKRPSVLEQAQQAPLASGGKAESHKISGSDDPALLSKRITDTGGRSQRSGLCKLQSPIGTASRNARKTREMERLFGTYDEDNDGRISSGELGSVMKKLGMEISEDDLNTMVRSVDKNGDGYVDFDEFLDFQNSLSVDNGSAAGDEGSHGNGTDDELREAFGVFDKNGDGFISVRELHDVLLRLGIRAGATITNCEKMISAVDSNGDGQVDFLEFKDLMAADSLLP